MMVMDGQLTALVRCVCLQAIVRLSLAKFATPRAPPRTPAAAATPAAAGPPLTPAQALDKMMTEHVLPLAERFEARAWMQKRLLTEEVDRAFREGARLPALHHLFESFAGTVYSNVTPPCNLRCVFGGSNMLVFMCDVHSTHRRGLRGKCIRHLDCRVTNAHSAVTSPKERRIAISWSATAPRVFLQWVMPQHP